PLAIFLDAVQPARRRHAVPLGRRRDHQRGRVAVPRGDGDGPGLGGAGVAQQRSGLCDLPDPDVHRQGRVLPPGGVGDRHRPVDRGAGLRDGADPAALRQARCPGRLHTFILPRKQRSPAQRQQAMEFIRTMLEQSLIWAEGGHVPAYLPTAESEEYLALEPQRYYAGAADHAVYDDPAWYGGSGSTFEDTVG